MKRLLLVVLALVTVGSLWSSYEFRRSLGENTNGLSPPFGAHVAQRGPEIFEVQLEMEPASSTYRSLAMLWYADEPGARDQLRHHTRRMIEHHPGHEAIYQANYRAFYVEPAYREEVAGWLEAQVEAGREEPDIFWNLALVHQHGAIPPRGAGEAEGRQRLRERLRLSDDVELPRELDEARLDRAIDYLEQAIERVPLESLRMAFYSRQLSEIQMRLGRFDEALVSLERAEAPMRSVSPGAYLLRYGRCLGEVGQIEEAMQVLGQIRELDNYGIFGGRSFLTSRAETQMGQFALRAGDPEAAVRHLRAAAAVQHCRHIASNGMPLALAEALLEVGEAAAVAEYCRTIEARYQDRRLVVRDLLARATVGEAGPVQTLSAPAN